MSECAICSGKYTLNDVFYIHNLELDMSLCWKHQEQLRKLCLEMNTPLEVF